MKPVWGLPSSSSRSPPTAAVWAIGEGMITFSIAAVLLSALAAVLILQRASGAARRPDADPTLAVYRRQLSEIDDLAERGLLAEGELKAARAEAARRLLGAAKAGEGAPAEAIQPRVSRSGWAWRRPVSDIQAVGRMTWGVGVPASQTPTAGPSGVKTVSRAHLIEEGTPRGLRDRVPSGSTSTGRRSDRVNTETAPRDQPRDDRVRVPHLAGAEVVAAPDGRRKLR